MNPYLRNLRKIEFVITYACTGKCKHCSEGDHAACGTHIDPSVAADMVCRIARMASVDTVMTFGGEPLLYPEAVYAIHEAAREMSVPHRQLITNGFFTKDPARIRDTAQKLAACGVNDLRLSVDAFHQETIPLAIPHLFAEEGCTAGIPIRVQPAWLKDPADPNSYNRKTKEILQVFADTGIRAGSGNVIFPEGNALRYLSEYFTDAVPENPYVEDPSDVRCVSFDPSGDVLGDNIFRRPIEEIMANYAP